MGIGVYWSGLGSRKCWINFFCPAAPPIQGVLSADRRGQSHCSSGHVKQYRQRFHDPEEEK